jgi:hypothetical protein
MNPKSASRTNAPSPADQPLGPQIQCLRAPALDERNPDALLASFATATPVELRQAWLEKPESDFAPASVWTAWREQSLLVLAQLTDADIFTGVTGLNQKAWLLGDTFEIFLRPAGQTAYVEFHVTPNNQHLQLRFPSAEEFTRINKAGLLENVMLPGEMFRSRTWVQTEARRWLVFAEIPARAVCVGPAKPLLGCQWHFSFSRYDYTRGRAEPVISSTSPHAVASFHRQQEWGTLSFR